MDSETLPATPKRDLALDATRTAAIWLMIACHVARLISKKHRPDWLDWCLVIEPLCQGLFLAMVGVSLTYSHRIFIAKQRPGWSSNQWRRSLQLYGIGVLFFLAQYGWQWPYTLINAGILMTIALNIALWTLLLSRSISLPVAFGIGLCLFGLDVGMEYFDFQSVFINSGAGPFFSHCVLTSFGIVAARILLDGSALTKNILVATMVVFGVVSLSMHSFVDLFDYPFGRKEFSLVYEKFASGPHQVLAFVNDTPSKSVTRYFYNYRIGLAPMLMALCTAIYLSFAVLRPVTQRLSWLWIVGKESLGVYVLHLVVIALITLVRGKVRSFDTAFEINLCFVAVTILCYGYAWWKQRPRATISVDRD